MKNSSVLKMMPLALVCAVFSTSVFSQEISNIEQGSLTPPKVSNNKNIELGLSVATTTVADKDDRNDFLEGHSISAGVGKIFTIGSQLTTTTSLKLSVSSFDDKYFEDTTEFKMRDIGLAQKLSINSEVGGITLQPFTEIGLSHGILDIHSQGSDSYGTYDVNSEVKYNKVSISLGLQALFQNGIAPYGKVEISNLKYTGDAKIESTTNGITDSYEVNDVEKFEIRQELVSVGLNILF